MKINFYEIFFSVVTYAWKVKRKVYGETENGKWDWRASVSPLASFGPWRRVSASEKRFWEKKNRRLFCSLRIKQNKVSGIYILFPFEAMDKGAWTERLIYYLFSALLGLGKGL